MKKLLQRWLAMVLAVLMVMGTLPTSAWAARITDDVVGENPVLDQNDPVADTQGRYDDEETGEKPVDPIDPDGPPADLGNININKVEVNTSAINQKGSVFATGTSADSNDTDSVEILILPLFTTKPSVSATAWITTKMQAGGSYGATAFAGDFHYNTTETMMANCDALKAVRQQSLPYAYFKTTTRTDVQTSQVTITWGDWVVAVENATAEKMTAGDPSQLNSNKLSEYVDGVKASGGNLYLTGSSTPLDTSTSLPFMIFMGGSTGFSGARLDLPVTGSPLKVEILTKDAQTKTSFQYRQTNASVAATKYGDQQYSEVRLSNSGSTDLFVNVTIARDKVTSKDPGDSYGNKADMTDNTDTIRAILTAADEGLTAPNPATNGTFTMQELYGLLAEWKGTVRTDGTVPGGSNVATANTLTNIKVPARGSTLIFVAGTRGKTGTADTAENQKWGNGLNGYKKGGTTGTAIWEYWSSYRITATDVSDPNTTDSDTAGIHWKQNPTTRPKVQLVHGDTVLKPDDDNGKIINSQDSSTESTATKKHTVQVGPDSSAVVLVWKEENQCYELAGTAATDVVSIGARIYVDGQPTSKVTLANADEIIQVPMYAVSVTDDPSGKAEGVLGSYMWDTKATETIKKASYKYYPENTIVGVYAKKDGFASWTGATAGAPLSPGGSPLEDSGSTATGGQLTVNADADVVANYIKPVTLITTWAGHDKLGDGTPSDVGQRNIDHVFKIRVYDTINSKDVATYTKEASTPMEGNIIADQSSTSAWTFDLSKGTYRLYINDRPIGSPFDPSNLSTYGDTEYNFVVELAGVIPQIDNSTQAGSAMTLPDDLNPDRERGDGTVTVTGAAPNTTAGDDQIILYYPAWSNVLPTGQDGHSVPVSGTIGSGVNFDGLYYGALGEDGDVQADNKQTTTTDAAAGTWKPATSNLTLTHHEVTPLVAKFATALGNAAVRVRVNDGKYENVTVTLTKDGVDNATTAGTGDDANLYTASDLEPGDYTVTLVKSGEINETLAAKLTVTAGQTETKTVDFYTLELTANQADSKDVGTVAQNSGTAGKSNKGWYLSGTSVNIAATVTNNQYGFSVWSGTDVDTWTDAQKKSLTNTVTMNKKRELQANFAKEQYTTYLKLTLNGKTVTDTDVADSGKDFSAVKLGSHDATYVAADGLWKVDGVLLASETGLTWSATALGTAHTANQHATKDDKTAYAEIDLYSVKVVPDSAGNDSTHQPKIDSKTRVILEAGGTATLASNGKNGFDYLKWVVVSNLGSEEEANPETEADIPTGTGATYSVGTGGTPLELKSTYTANAELVLRPKFTFRVPVELHYHTATGDLVAGQTVTVDPGTGITVANKESSNTGEFVISGMTTGSTYTVKVNGYASTLTLADTMASTTTAQKIVLHRVSAVSESKTKGTVTLAGGTAVKYLPDSATDATGWAIAATAKTGYREGDAAGTFWAITTGAATETGGYGELAGDQGTSMTLKVTKAIHDDVTATAYFTQQFDATIKIKIGNGSAATNADRAYFTKEEGSGVGTSLGTPAVTATVDTAGYVVGHYVDADAQKLISWTVTGGKLYADAGKTTEITSGADSNVKTVYFFPSAAGATITANVAATYTLTYKDAWSAKTGATCPDAVSGLLAGNYTIPNTAKPTGAATGWSFNGWSTTGAAANKTTTVDPSVNNTVYAVWDVTLTWSANYGDTPATSTSTVTLGSNTTTPTNGTVGTVKADLTRTGYKFEGWYTAATGGDKVTASTAVSGPATYYAHWTENTARVTVTKNDAAYTGYNETLTLKASGKADIAGTKAGTPSVTGAIEYTFPTLEAGVEYTVYVGNTATYLKVTGVAGSEAKETLKYYDITLTNDDGKGYIALSTSALNSTLTADGTKTGTFLKGTQVNIRADAQNATNYSFSEWVTTKDGTNAGGTAPVATSGAAAHSTNVASLEAQTQIDAVFTKSSYNTQLHVTLNGKDAVIDDDITAVSCSGGTVSGPVNGVWTATAITKQETWTVTVRGGATYTVSTNGDMDEVAGPEEMPLYSVDVVKGDYGNDDSHAPYIGTDGITRKIVRKTGADNSVNVTLTPNPKTGFKRASWINAAEGATALPNGASVSGDTVTLADAYKPTDGTGLVLKPTFTFDTTVVTVHGTDPTDVTKVQLKAGTDAAITLNKETTGTGNHTGRYTATDLDPTKTYDIIVNDFLSTENVTQANAGGAKEVKIFSVTVQEKDKYTAALTPDGNAYVKLGANATGASVKSVYLPIGAKTTDGATDVTKVNLTAAVGTTNPKFRLWDKDDSTTDDRDETLWNVETITGVPTGKTMTAAIATTTGTGALTPNNLKVGGADGMQADVTVTAYFVRQYAASVSVAGNGNADTKAEFTDKQYFATSIAANKASATVDELTYVKAEFSAGTGDKLANWEFTGGSLYSALKADGTVDTTTALTSKADATAAYTTVYFVPSADNAKLIANVIPKKYTVMVTANLDNVAKTDATVELHYTEGGTAKVAAMTYNETGKVYKSNDELPFNTTYTIWTNIATQTTTTESAIKTITFTAAQAEADTNLSEEVNYYTINLAVDPDSSGTVDFGTLSGGSHTTPPANTAGTTAKMIVLAKSTTQPINIRSAPYVNEAGGVRYRFDTWTATKRSNAGDALEIGSFEKGGTPEKIYQSGAYTLPKESDLKTYTDTINGPTKQLTLTAKMKQRWKVSVDKGLNADNNTVPQVSLSSTSGWDNNYVYVDDGDPVYLQTSSIGNKLHFMDWTIKKVGNVAQGAGEFNKNTAAATDKTAGTLKENGTNYPKNLNDFIPTKDTVIVVNLWKEADAKAQWTYDKGTGTLTSTTGNPLPPNITWAPNHGETPTTLAIQKRAVEGGAAGTRTPLTKDTDYTVSADGLTYTLDFESATLSALELGTYDVYFTYTLGDDGDDATTEHNPVPNTQAPTFFILTATKRTLRQVDIGVSTDTTATTLNEHAAAKDQAVYVRHWEKNPANSTSTDLIASDAATNASKIPHDELEFTWYYSNTAPNASSPSKIYANAAAVTTEVNRVSATALTTDQATALVKAWTDGTHNIATGTLNVDAATLATLGDLAATLQGKNIFAVVKVKDDSVVAEGTVITNSILVDYDASVKVQQNGTGIAAANKDDYRVYFVPSTVTPVLADFATADAMTAKSIVQATYNTTLHDGTYETSGSALDPNKNYNVYVNDAQGVYTAIVNSGAKTITRLDKANRVVDFYTVTPIDFTWHECKTNSGETTSEVKIGSLTTANNTAIDLAHSKYGVLKGSNVKALADDTNWTQDYNLSWQAVEGAAFNTNSPYDVVAANKTKTDATTNGYTWNTVDAATIIGGRLIQNTYTLTGVIRDVNGATGGESGELNTATLTIKNGENTITYTGTVGSSGREKGTVSFTVPKGTYTLTSTVKTGSTHKGYYKGNDTSAKPAEATPKHVPDTPQNELKLDELTAGTNGATVSGRFTIYVVKTALTLNLKDQDSHTTNNISGTNKATATHTVKTDEEAKIVFNYDAFPETVTVKNMGNTPLKLTATLQSKALTDADTAFTSVTLTAGEDGKGTTFVYTKKIAADGTETTETTNLVTGNDGAFVLQPGEAREVTITIPDSLENKDDLTYRLTFDAKDGRDGTTQGPVVGYDLKVEIDPVTVYHVGTKQNDDGSYTAQYTWIKEDSTDITSTANANGQSYQKLEKPVTTDADRAPDPTNDDLIYSWYVASWDAVVSLDANGNPTGGDVAPGQGDVSTNGLTYTPKDTEYGKALYLVVKGQNNATGAAMTPDRTKDEEPVPVPYAGKVEIWHNDDKQPATGNDAPEGYAVYLWDKSNTGDFNLNDAIATTWDSTGNYFATKITDLWPGEDYAVYTNIVRGQTTKASDFAALTGVNIDETHQEVVKAVYRQVKVANTKVTQSGYDTYLGTVESAKSNYFFQNADGATVKATPAEKPSAGVAGFDGVDVANDWVRTGTTVTFTYPKWTKDYNLSWTGGVTATGNNADKPNTENISHTATYSSQLVEVKTSLDLNLYNVSAHVVGSVGHVGYIDMTLTDKVGEDAGKTYTFTTKDGVADKIWGTKNVDWNDNIKISQTAVFHLPNAIDYVVSGMNDVDSAAEFAGYSYNGTDYDYVKPEDGIEEENKTINVTVNGPTEYDVRLKGDGLAMRVKGNVPASLEQKNLVDPATTSVGGQATILPDGTAPAGSAANDTVYLNYNYKKDLTVIVTASNESKQGADEDASSLKDVTFVANAFDTNKFAVAENKFATGKDLGRTGTSSADWKGESDTVTLTIKQGLAVGTHTFSGTFTFKDNSTPQVQNTVTYTLTVIVEPLEFTAVSIDEKAGVSNGTLTITDYTVTRKAEAGDPATPTLTTKDTPAATATDADEKTALKQTPDYGYQWIRTAPGVTVPNVASVSASGALTSSGTANYTVIAGAKGKEYTPVTADEGQNLYLVIYGTDDAAGTRHNATGFAVSPARVNTYQGIVYINVDGTRVETSEGNADPGYTVEFYSDDQTPVKIESTWKEVETGKYAYVSNEGLTPGLEYTVKVSRAKDDTTTVALTKKLTGTKIGKTIALTGTPDTNNFTNVTQADYFTVTAVKLTPKAFNDSPSTAETFTGEIIPTLTIGTGNNAAELTNKTPVLSGQSVKATIADAWTQDYTLTWQMDNADGADDSFTDANNTSYVQDAAAAVATGYPHGTVAAKTFIGGRLDQNTYTIVGHVKGKTTPQKNQVVNVTLKSNKNVLYYSDTNTIAPTAAIHQNAWAEPLGVDGYHNTGDTITFTVVAGTYDVTAYEGEGYTIRSVTIPTATGTAGATRNTNQFNTDVKDLDADARHFWINLEPAGPQLKVTDTEDPAHTATSGTGETDYRFADNNDGALYVYKTLTADDVFTLNLHNPGNVDLTLKELEVHKLDANTDYSDSDKLRAALTSTTKKSITANGWTDKDGTRTIVTIAGLPDLTDDDAKAVEIGAGETGSDVNAVPAGSITVNQNVYNKDDAIYVVKYVSQYETTGGEMVDGPTVYYVLNLKVEPLPLKKLDIERVGTSDKLRLKGFDSTDSTNKTGLDNVKVDADGKADTTELATAKDKALTTPGDISFVWVKAPADMERDDVVDALSLDKTNNKMLSSHADVKVTTVTDREHTPVAADQGLNFYLVAFRTNADSNADDFAVSNAMYAQVTVSMKAYRTGETTKDDDHALTDVFISHGTGESMKKSNGGKVVVTGIEDGANELDFSATKTDVTAKDTTNDPPKDNPNAAKYYFHHWAVQPLTGDELNATDDSVTTPVEGERLDMKYTATANSTVIGYFDLLPVLNGFGGYNTGDNSPGKDDTAAAKLLRTMNYRHNDGMGAGNVEIIIKKGTGSFIKEDSSVDEISLNNVGYFETVAGTSSGDPSAISKFGGDGAYVFTHTWLKDNLGEGTYTITFYDKGKGQYSNPLAKTLNAGGYAGYDKSFTLTISQGEKEVTAKVNLADGETNPGHQVRLSNDKPNDQLEAGEKNDTGLGAGPVQLYTFNGSVNIFATPADGYVFTGWTRADGEDDGTFGAKYEEDGTTKINDTFTPAKPSRTILANFRKVAYTTTPGHAKIHYGTKSFLANSDEHPDYYKDLDITTADTATTVLTYEWLTGADLTAYLTETTANGGAGLSAADAAALVTKTAVAKYTTDGGTTTGWLDWNGTTHKFEVKAAAKGVNVEKKTEDGALKDVGNELVVYVKVTETNSEQEFVIPFTIDIMTSELKIRTDGTNASSGGDGHTQDDDQRTADGSAYKTKYIAENGADNTKVFTDEDSGAKYIINGNAIELDKFEFISIDNVNDDSNEDKLIGPADSGKHNAGEDLDGENNPTSIVNGKGKWIITVPTNGLLNGSGNQTPENANLYTFQFVYTGVDEGDDKAADDYNYTSPTISLNIPVQRPARSLKFADEVTNNADLKKGTAYSEVEEPAGYDVTDDTVTAAPTKLAYTDNTYRTNEGITYLDKEPEYTVKLQRTGNLKDITLTIDPKNAEGEAEASVGFVLVDKDGNEIALDNAAALKTLLDTAAGALNADGTETALKLKLAPVHDNVWVGKHYIRFKLEGTDDLNAKVTAYYTLSIDVAPKVITKLDVTVTDPETEPTKVEGTTDDKKVNDKDEDDKGNVPITDVTVTWGPEENKPDGKNTEVKVDVKIDPNYVYAEDDPTTPDDNEDIEHKTDLTVAEHGTPKPADVNRDETDEKHIVHITQKIPYLMHDDAKEDGSDPKGPAINHSRTVAVAPSTTAEQLGKYTINLGAYGGNVYDVQWTVEDAATSKLIGNGEGSLGATLGTLPTGFDLTGDGAKQSVELDLTTITGTLAAGSTYSFTLKAIGKANDVTDEEPSIISLYTFTLRVSNPPTPGGGGSVEPCPCKVLYHIGLHGTTTDATIEDVSENNRPVKVPAVTALDGYVFRGWSLSNPATLKKGEKPVLVDPKTVDVKGESMIFYAVIVERPFHEHYVIGYPNGNFGPADDIDRASVATIIARAILPDFKEGANYGNPGKYTDVSGHWAESAIAYCSKFGVFEGYTDGTFKPNQPITRQEFALVIARLDGVMTPGEMDFTDIDEAGPWALGGIYTAYEKGWVNGYTDGTFKPLNNIRRDEAVKVFNAYLNRGVDADGLAKLHEYVHSGVASNVTGNGTDEYMTWPDVPQDHWAYYEIVEAANDHEYEPDFESELGYTLPETWDKCWIDERWRYHDDINDGGPNAALVSAGFRVWLH